MSVLEWIGEHPILFMLALIVLSDSAVNIVRSLKARR